MGPPPAEPPAGYQPAQSRSLLNYAKHADFMVFLGWTISTTLPVGFLGPLRYLAAAYFAGAFLLFARQVSPAVARCWPLFLLPILCTISAIWAPSMNEALRKGFSLALTALVAIYVATRIPGRKILLAYFLAELIAAVISLRTNTIASHGAWTGMFGQKNFFAVNMFILYVAALGLILDRENGRWIRRVSICPTACKPWNHCWRLPPMNSADAFSAARSELYGPSPDVVANANYPEYLAQREAAGDVLAGFLQQVLQQVVSALRALPLDHGGQRLHPFAGFLGIVVPGSTAIESV